MPMSCALSVSEHFAMCGARTVRTDSHLGVLTAAASETTQSHADKSSRNIRDAFDRWHEGTEQRAKFRIVAAEVFQTEHAYGHVLFIDMRMMGR